MEMFLQFLVWNLIAIVALICGGAVIDLLTGGKILRRKSQPAWLQATMDQHAKLLEERKEIDAQWHAIEDAIREQTRQQPLPTSSTESTASDSPRPPGSSSPSGPSLTSGGRQ